jgi:RimJ/RimL family protein N-acetyltransferase
MIVLNTDRLILRTWQDEDLIPFFAINQDPLVMEFMPALLTKAQADTFIQSMKEHFNQHGFGLYACVLRETNELIGFVGLNIPNFETHFTPCVEVGWRLSSQHWGKGYATEAAMVAMEDGFLNHQLNEIVSFTVPLNVRSRRVMEKLGMKNNSKDDFNHPKLPLEHPLSLHVLYRIKKLDWQTVNLGKK